MRMRQSSKRTSMITSSGMLGMSRSPPLLPRSLLWRPSGKVGVFKGSATGSAPTFPSHIFFLGGILQNGYVRRYEWRRRALLSRGMAHNSRTLAAIRRFIKEPRCEHEFTCRKRESTHVLRQITGLSISQRVSRSTHTFVTICMTETTSRLLYS